MGTVVVVGAGPNGLAAAVTMARAGHDVTVYDSNDEPGGGARSLDLFGTGAVHDPCSSIHPLALASPFFRAFGLTERLEMSVPSASYGHPLDAGPALVAYRDLGRTADELGRRSGAVWRRTFCVLSQHADAVAELATGPMPPRVDRVAVRFGLGLASAMNPSVWPARAAALFSGVAAHGNARLGRPATTAVGMALATYAHGRGWGFPVGGTGAITAALVADLVSHGGKIHTGTTVRGRKDLPNADVILFDTSPKTLDTVLDGELSTRFARRFDTFGYGAGVCSVDLLLDGPIPWADERLGEAPSVHLGGSASMIARAELEVSRGRHPARPYTLVNQPGSLDGSRRGPLDLHPISTYCHVPGGSTVDMTDAILRQIERFAPGVRDRIVALNTTTAAERGAVNTNDVGGDINAGALTLAQLVRRPILGRAPWRTSIAGVYLCSAATSPGTGVHGMSGYGAAAVALRDVFGQAIPDLQPERAAGRTRG
jgi:phytoene dehydrogenase-like protein